LRNIFDQYSQPENRITHAFMTALNEDRTLLGRFLQEVIGVKLPDAPASLSVLAQQYPGELEPSEIEAEQRGIPDGWIFNDDGWCVFIECKVLTELRSDQLRHHRRTAERLGFDAITAVAIAPHQPTTPPLDAVFLEWRTIYAWLRTQGSDHPWAKHAAAYLEVAEAKLIGTGQFVEGTLTMFSGIPFGPDHPFNYLEGKRVLGLLMGQLRGSTDLVEQIGVDPSFLGRGAIKGSKADRVWDVLAIKTKTPSDKFSEGIHLTLGVASTLTEAMVTVPNAVNVETRKELVRLGPAGFQALIEQIVANLSPVLDGCTGAVPVFRGQQRRWMTRSGPPVGDAMIEFDLRTAVPGGPPKRQPRWLSAGFGSFLQKEGANYEFQVGVRFPHERCPELRNPEAAALIAAALVACKPLTDLAR
jgi:hypothetical protein